MGDDTRPTPKRNELEQPPGAADIERSPIRRYVAADAKRRRAEKERITSTEDDDAERHADEERNAFREMQEALAEALKAHAEGGRQLDRELAYRLFLELDDIAGGRKSELLSPLPPGPGAPRRRRGEKRAIGDVVMYLKWAEAGLIDDADPRATIRQIVQGKLSGSKRDPLGEVTLADWVASTEITEAEWRSSYDAQHGPIFDGMVDIRLGEALASAEGAPGPITQEPPAALRAAAETAAQADAARAMTEIARQMLAGAGRVIWQDRDPRKSN